MNNLGIIYSRSIFPDLENDPHFNKYAHDKPVYALTFDLGAIYPAVIYSSAHNNSRYGHLWMLPGMYVGQPVKNGEMVYRLPNQMGKDEAAIFKNVITEILDHKPAVITVTAFDHGYRNGGVDYKFDFIKYLSGDSRFKEFWHSYKKFSRVDYQDVYILR